MEISLQSRTLYAIKKVLSFKGMILMSLAVVRIDVTASVLLESALSDPLLTLALI